MFELLKRTIFIIGYLFLVGPPRAFEILERANRSRGELMGKPLWVVMIAEFTLRAGLFLLVAVAIESLLEDELFERYQIDLFLGVLIISGVVHSLSYYLVFRLSRRNMAGTPIFFYRFGRNIAYAVIPAFVAAGIALVWQDLNQKELFSGELIQSVFTGTWGLFLLLGMLETLLVRRIPTGLGEVLRHKLSLH